jgi:DNA-binding XRE family transcriptional regulator
MEANNMRFYRKKAGLTQEELGKMLHISKSAVSLKESGKRTISIEEAKEISKFLKAPVKKIFFA